MCNEPNEFWKLFTRRFASLTRSFLACSVLVIATTAQRHVVRTAQGSAGDELECSGRTHHAKASYY